MKRMTHRCADGNAECNMSKDICFALHQDGEKGCWGCDLFPEIIDRLASIEDILGDTYDLDRLEVMMTQCMSMREEVSERFRITGSIPVERLRELVEADKAGRCVVIPENYDGAMFRVWKNQILSSEKFAWMMKKLGKSFFLTHKAAEAALAKEK